MAGLAASDRTEPLPRWRDRVFILERAQRALVGQLLAKPERWPFLRLVGLDHLDGTARTVYRVLSQLRARAVPWADRSRLRAEVARAGVDPHVVDDWAAEWEACPERLSDLESALEAAYIRRRLDTAGRALVEVARDPDPIGDLEVLRVVARHVRDDLDEVLARGERG